ncbi:hypothetical protein D9M68_913960 [compost metagenome]
MQKSIDALRRTGQEQVDALFGQQDRALEPGLGRLIQQAQAQRRQVSEGHEFVSGDIDDGSHGKAGKDGRRNP